MTLMLSSDPLLHRTSIVRILHRYPIFLLPYCVVYLLDINYISRCKTVGFWPPYTTVNVFILTVYFKCINHILILLTNLRKNRHAFVKCTDDVT